MKKKKRLLLIGGGHAHMHFMKMYSKEKIKDFELILVSSENKQYYSGMASAFLEDIYSQSDFSFDLPQTCSACGIEFILGTVLKIDAANKMALLKNGRQIAFDVLSIDVGSKAFGKSIEGVSEYATTVKPLSNFLDIKNSIKNSNSINLKITIVGAGAAGVEMGLALKEYSRKLNKKVSISLISSGKEILNGYNVKIKNRVLKILEKSDIKIILNEKVKSVDHNTITTSSQKSYEYNKLIWATGVMAGEILKNSDFICDSKDFMSVNTYLQSINFPYIFGAGDCISLKDYDYVRKVGVYAIRQAPFLWKNVNNHIEKSELIKYVPQKKFLSIISLGNKKAILFYKGIIISGRIAWFMKDKIDRKFMKDYKDI